MVGKPSAQSATAGSVLSPLGAGKRAVYPREAKLLRTADYKQVYERGVRRQFGWTAAFLLRSGNQSSRIGITVPRHFGMAVDRNRMKRRLRGAIAQCLGEAPAGWDIVLHPRNAGLKLESADVLATLKKIFDHCAKQSSK